MKTTRETMPFARLYASPVPSCCCDHLIIAETQEMRRANAATMKRELTSSALIDRHLLGRRVRRSRFHLFHARSAIRIW